MYLNGSSIFQKTKGMPTYEKAAAKLSRVMSTVTKPPLHMVIPRYRDGVLIDFVPVVILRHDTLHNPIFYASKGIFVTDPSS